jgi:biotin synthase
MQHPLIATVLDRLLQGGSLAPGEGRALAALGREHTTSLLFAANAVMKARGRVSFTCSIVNAKSGTCSQDCAFCAQSGHYRTGSPTHPLLPLGELVERGLAMHAAGASCYSIVTSGLRLDEDEIGLVCSCLRELRRRTDMTLSASLGLLTPGYVRRLTEAGLSRYHHNLETARSHFPAICTTHEYDQDIETVLLAKENGLQVCSGGILGLGESWDQRIELAATLAELGVDTVPLNFLNPIPGTPLQDMELLTPHDALKSVALFRLMMPDADITVAGGREKVLGDYQSWLPLAGANGMMIGNYLTTRGRDLDADTRMLEQGSWI